MEVKPEEMLFALENDVDLGCIVVYTTPEDYFRDNGCMYDQSVVVKGFDLPELMEATFESPDDWTTTRDKLLALGMKEDYEFTKFIKWCSEEE